MPLSKKVENDETYKAITGKFYSRLQYSNYKDLIFNLTNKSLYDYSYFFNKTYEDIVEKRYSFFVAQEKYYISLNIKNNLYKQTKYISFEQLSNYEFEKLNQKKYTEIQEKTGFSASSKSIKVII